MNRILKHAISGMVCVSITLCGIYTAHAYAIMSAGGFSPYPTKIISSNGFASAVNSAISSSCSAWNSAGIGTLVTRSSQTHSNSSFPLKNSANQITATNKGVTGQIMLTNLTQVKVSGLTRYHTEVDININTSYPWATNGDSRAYDVQNCFTHELGHLLGLDDEVSKSSSTMYMQTSIGETAKRTLAADDINGLKAIY
ncbi:MAG: matrixin family metalloprotease [Clostridiaceae bacterium]|nr:matrixin family metalloprotease [Clostridiaceae bacterium]